MKLQAGPHEIVFPRPALVMGVVNVTPDSFSDGGKHLDPEAAERHGRRLVEEGAEWLDIGGESTRPRAKPVDEAEELRRVIPVIERLAASTSVPLSIDTRKPGVAREALRAGAVIVNDVGANRADPAMWRVVAESGAGYVAMHMQGAPETMQSNPVYKDVVREVGDFFADRLERLRRAGVRSEQVLLDVGVGFGKDLTHNLELLAALKTFKTFERPLMLGVSRKSFIGKLLGAEVEDRLPAGLACACWGVQSGVQVVRAHDVAATVQAARMWEAIIAHEPS